MTADPADAFCGMTINRDGIPYFICTLPPHGGLVHENLGARARMVGGKWLVESGTHLGSPTLPSRTQIESRTHTAWSDVRSARMDSPEAQAGYEAAADEHDSREQS